MEISETFKLSRFCVGVPDGIGLFRFLVFSAKKFSYSHNVSSAVQKLTQINVFSLFDSIIYSDSYLECLITITVLSSTKLLFWKHLIRTFGCYFERHTFDSIINRGKPNQKLSSEFFFFFFGNIKIKSNSRFLKYYIRVYQR